MRLLFLLVFAGPSAAWAVNASVCVRNDGVGTFQAGDLEIEADTTPNSGDEQITGPTSALAPGQQGCYTIAGLTPSNGFGQYQYTFSVSFTDTSGDTTVMSAPALSLTGSGTWYISTAGVSPSAPPPADAFSLQNQAPPGYSTIQAYPDINDPTTVCYVYWNGSGGQPFDFEECVLERASSPGGPWIEIGSWITWGTSYEEDWGLTPGTTYHYRVIQRDDYGAETITGPASCTTEGGAPLDTDGDGEPDGTDCAPGDASRYPGAVELCDGLDQDCDGLADEGWADLDSDTIADCVDDDDDGDGRSDEAEDEAPTTDADGDGTPNSRDTDSDNDGLPDSDEGDEDKDGDDLPAWLDPSDLPADDDDTPVDDDTAADDDTADDDTASDDDAGDDDSSEGATDSEFEGDEAGECADGADNDRDTAFDCDDADCDGAPDCDEEGPRPRGGCSCESAPVGGPPFAPMFAAFVVASRRRSNVRSAPFVRRR